MNLKIGCCGFPVARGKYFKKFKIVELQRTFYRLPKLETAKKWRETAPEGFEFSLKAWQLITHLTSSPTYRKLNLKLDPFKEEKYGFFKPTDEVFEAWEKTEKIAAALKAKTIVFQCPASFGSDSGNKKNIRKFFRTIKRKKYKLIWEARGAWEDKDIIKLCDELDLIHCVDPFEGKVLHGDIRYFRLHGKGDYNYRYTGMDLKRLRDFCEQEAQKIKRKPIYVFFNNTYMMDDAQRFDWIVKNTGRIRDVSLNILHDLCKEIDAREEDEKVQQLSREAERIVMLILHTDYAKIDIEIEKSKLRDMCKELFPGKDYLFEMIYEKRFDRLWEQFRKE